MATAVAQKTQAQLVNFDTEGNVVVNKTSDASAKLIARRAIEAHLERKSMHLDDEWDLDD
ncbi:hypothetical protein A9Q73_09015 [Bermanella sp. 47_1433_sub80_T6]|mgnify:FL=1|nr:hypothetical protein A9Q73_09015 [Bermanella sp. 47_1433_sub80_T6]